jgi:heme/copper-type cytochrome/quinol oxidase subunit 2
MSARSVNLKCRLLTRVAVFAIAAAASFIIALELGATSALAQSQPRIVQVLADHDSRYKIDGRKQPVITVKAGEEILLRVTAIKAKGRNRDGSIHGFSLLRAKDRAPVEGWDLLLKPGIQEFHLTAPSEPGDYVVICTVICSQDHEQMMMKFVVEP